MLDSRHKYGLHLHRLTENVLPCVLSEDGATVTLGLNAVISNAKLISLGLNDLMLDRYPNSHI